MSYTVLQLKEDLIGVGHGLSLNKVQSPNSLITRAANELLSEIDFFEATKEEQIANSIFDSIYDYSAPDDLKMDKVIDIYPQVNRNVSDLMGRRYREEFDRKKSISTDLFTIEYINGTKRLRIAKDFSKPAKQPVSIGDFSSLSNNGTWTVGGDATNLRVDNVNYVSGTASLRFDLSGAGTTWFIEADDITAVDLSTKTDGSLFNWAWLPDASQHTDLTLRWGSSSSDYYEVTVTQQFFDDFVDGWNQMEYLWDNATTTGTPDDSSIVYIHVGGTYDGSVITDMRIDSVVSLLGTKYLIKYYGNKIFKDATTGALKERVTDDSDIIILENASQNLLLYASAFMMAQQVQDQGGSIDIEFFVGLYNNAKSKYLLGYKSETNKPKSRYWTERRGRNGGRRGGTRSVQYRNTYG